MVKDHASSPSASPQDGLEASLAEMRCLNEELSTVNRQLQDRIVELEAINDDLRHRLASTEMARLSQDGEAAIRASDERVDLALQAVAGTVYDWRLSTDQIYRSEGLQRLIGTSPEQAQPSAAWWTDRVHPDDLTAVRAVALQAFSGNETAYAFEYRLLHDDGRWVDVWDRGLILRDRNGRATRAVGIAIDVSERKRAEEHDRLLMAELDHRVKNILASIAAVARQTSVDKASVEEFVEALIGRVQAMARAHSLLSLSRWEGASLHSLVAEELAPYRASDESFAVQGESILLRPKAAQALAMALHELATNAAKHGAFALPGGRVEVTWHREEKHQAVVLIWRELAHRPIAPPAAQGFGSIVLEQLLPHELGARVALDYQPAGLVCTLRIPLSQFSRTSGTPDSRPLRAGEPGPASSEGAPMPGRVLIVEHSAAVAAEFAGVVEELGCEVVGPADTLEEAFELARTSRLQAAILEIDLAGSDVYPLAERLADARVPFVFVSGYQRAFIEGERFADAPVLDKPVHPQRLAATLLTMLATRSKA